MSAFVFAIILVVGYSVVSVVKSLLSDHSDVKGTPVSGEVFPKIDGEVFPKIEIYNTEEPDVYVEKPVTQAAKPDVKKKVSKKVEGKGIPAVQEVTVEKEDKEKISLKNRSEAKRAFIHAEILNRKY